MYAFEIEKNKSGLIFTAEGIMKALDLQQDFSYIKQTYDGSTSTCIIKRKDTPEFKATYGLEEIMNETGIFKSSLLFEKLGESITKNKARRACFIKAYPELNEGVKS